VGDVKGIVKMLSLSKVQDNLQCVSSTEVWPYSDRIQVTKLFTLPCNVTEDCPLTIVVIKGGFVIAVALDMDGMIVATCPYLVGNLSVTGKLGVSRCICRNCEMPLFPMSFLSAWFSV
jgi:hypothetical protein